MQLCSEFAYAMCPDRAHCGSRTEAVFADDSECAAFNRSAEVLSKTTAGTVQCMTAKQAKIILAYAECNMNTVATGRKIYMSEANVSYHLAKIRNQTGLSPKCFYDLCRLVGIATQRLGGVNAEQAG